MQRVRGRLTAYVMLMLLLAITSLGFHFHRLSIITGHLHPLVGRTGKTTFIHPRPVHSTFSHSKESRHNNRAMQAVVGRNLYVDNYVDRRQTKLTALLLTLYDMITDPRIGQIAPYFILLGMMPFYFIFRKFSNTMLGRKDNKFPVYECEHCQYQIRPVRGSIAFFFGDSSFRCPKCGAQGNSYFDIDDPSDSRAVMRLKRLERNNKK